MNSSRRQFLMAAGMVGAIAKVWNEAKGNSMAQQEGPGLNSPPLPPLPDEATHGPWRNLRAVREKKVFDFHTHTYETATQSTTYRGTGLMHQEGHYVDFTEYLIGSMERYGVDRAFLTPAFVKPAWETVRDTSYKKYPKRFVLAAVVRDRQPKPTIAEAAKMLREQLKEGCRGIGEGGLPDYKTPSELKPVMDVVMEFDIPVQIHTGWTATGTALGRASSDDPDTPPYAAAWRFAERFGELAAYYPEVKLVMAHTGGRFDFLDGYEALRVAFSFDNVYVETAKSTARIITEAVRGLGAEKVIFGSDWNRPQTKAYGPKHYRDVYQHWYNLNQVALADITEDERDMILYKNALRLLKLSA